LLVPATSGFGYEYMNGEGKSEPKADPPTEWLRPQPEALSIPCSSKYPGAFIDKLLSEDHTREVAKEVPILKLKADVLK
jgi:hypothetical protein